MQPDQEKREGGKATVNGIITGQRGLNVDVYNLEQLENRAGYDSGGHGAAGLDFGVRNHHVEEGEHHPNGEQREESEKEFDCRTWSDVQQSVLQLQTDAVGYDPQNRYDYYDRNVVTYFACDAA